MFGVKLLQLFSKAGRSLLSYFGLSCTIESILAYEMLVLMPTGKLMALESVQMAVVTSVLLTA